MRTLLQRSSLPIDYLFLSVPSKMVVETNHIDFHQHSMSLLHPGLSHISNIAITSTSVQTVTEDSWNYSRNHKHNPGCYKGIATCRSCNYWNLHESHSQWRLRVYIHWETPWVRGRTAKRKEITVTSWK